MKCSVAGLGGMLGDSEWNLVLLRILANISRFFFSSTTFNTFNEKNSITVITRAVFSSCKLRDLPITVIKKK